MEKIERTVFISYRRVNTPWALAIYQDLTANGFDVFFDYNSIKSGSFEQIIMQNIRGRAHFLALLTPSALERCNEPNDWLRREIETAIIERRNIVPLFFDGFNFGSPTISKYLTGTLVKIKEYNGLTVPAEYFSVAMERLRIEFLNIPLNAVLHPISIDAEKAAQIQQKEADSATKVERNILTAQEWHEKGVKFIESENYNEAIHACTEAIRLDPSLAKAYNNRGVAFASINDHHSAVRDYNESIRIDPKLHEAHYNLGIEFADTGDIENAIRKYTDCINNNSNYVNAYINRGVAFSKKNKKGDALNDYTKAIELNANSFDAYANRAKIHLDNENHDSAIQDCNESIRINPKHVPAYNNRGVAHFKKREFKLAIEDFSKSIQINSNQYEAYFGRGIAHIANGNLILGASDLAKSKILKS